MSTLHSSVNYTWKISNIGYEKKKTVGVYSFKNSKNPLGKKE